MPLFSIVIPTYNRAAVLLNTLKSVFAQTETDYEVIIIDDGSKDNTEELVTPYLSEKVQYFKQDNQGAQVARNFGLSKATGEYICFLDSDDLWLPEFLAEVLQEFKKDDEIGCVYCYMGYMRDGTLEILREDTISGWVYEKALRQGYLAAPSFLVAKRKCFDTVGNWDIDFVACQDEDMFFRLAKHYKFKLIPKVLGIYGMEYNGADNRICNSRSKLANGWWTLWNKFEKDTLEICGRKCLSTHFLKGASWFIEAGNNEMARESITKAISLYESKNEMINTYEHGIRKFVPAGGVYCYGAGTIGAVVKSFFDRIGLKINAFIVSERNGKDYFFGLPLFSIDEMKDLNCEIVITASEKYHDVIEKNIREKSDRITVFKITGELYYYMKAINYISNGI